MRGIERAQKGVTVYEGRAGKGGGSQLRGQVLYFGES